MARKTKEDAENTRAMILNSALNCFYEKGFSRTGFEDIARPIGLTKGAVYWHFKNKADVLAALIRQKVEVGHREIGEEFSHPDSIDGLRLFFLREAEYIESNPNLQKFLFFSMFQVEWSDNSFKQVTDELGEISDYHFKTVKEALTSAQKRGEIAPDINVDTVALIIVSAWRGMVNTYISKDMNFSLSKVFVEGLDVILDRIEVRKAIER